MKQGMEHKKPIVLMMGMYDMDDYARAKVLYKGLKENRINVKTCLRKGFFGYLGIISSVLKKDYDVLILNGRPLLFAVRPFTRKPIILDAFISIYDTEVNDTKHFKKGSFKANLTRFVDRWSCKLSDRIILDTEEHIYYFAREFRLKKEKFDEVFVGAEEDIFRPMKVKKEEDTGKFLVLFYGTFIPLHGVDYILRNIKKLEKNKDIIFKIIGKGQTYDKSMRLAKELRLKRTEFVDWVKYKDLPQEIAKADICLGNFGNTGKSKRVIVNKIFQCLACKKPVITIKSGSSKRLFRHKENIYLCDITKKDALAKAILELKENPGLRTKIAENGYKLYKKRFTIRRIGKDMINVIKKSLKKVNEVIKT